MRKIFRYTKVIQKQNSVMCIGKPLLFFFFWIRHLKAVSGAIEIDGNFSVAKQKLIANAERMR